MQTRSGAEITFDGEVVCKLHRAGTDPRALRTRLTLAGRLRGTVLAPLTVVPEPVGSRWRTRWPRVDVVVPQPDRLPWAEAGALLARLHAHPVDARLPHGWPARLRRAVEQLRTAGAAAEPVRRAAAGLPPAVWRAGSPERPRTVVHGDFHLGQLGRRDDGPWLLIDVDDLGVGDPAWDLARPAGFWAAGHIPDADWAAFLDAYRQAGGAALIAAAADPWPVLEPFARAAVVVAAAHHPDDELLVEACARMA
ncbi:phosphotransferase enzyme family protein [Mycolicibacterium litorale]|uniref:Aminoglycoside phosphotransferase n=1 Tax=Mycolicibacterium litorale TaxID=758802 RepID=A0AAD1IP13_9MYCO|nr:aminoglycoside phosphotransferase family protein [Mycolicibacterium litorale]MCV7417767.1 aminoglycoside phosphotransferase family protein [Mycolicibacterium litorale]TDY06843.1 phosphotransferase family enzyme [Mycolicibacterium litorale]BBY18999.1 aminoglycoside phosphotransferase [Mycolicibacterium litorale]